MKHTIDLSLVPNYYKELPHQKKAVQYLGELLLNTPAAKKFSLKENDDWIKLKSSQLQWLQRQISQATLNKFIIIWRSKIIDSFPKQAKFFSQRDNKINPLVSCNSSSHAIFVDYVLRNILHKKGLVTDDEYVQRVYSGKYGTYKNNNSLSWDVQLRVCRSFGVQCYYSNKGKRALIKEIQKGLICPANFRHKGNMYKSYGGHVSVVVDYNKEKGFLIYDPYGTRMPSYKEKFYGVYWISEKEFDYRFQGIFTTFKAK